MMRNRPLSGCFALLVILGPALAGCSQKDAEPVPDPGASETTAGVFALACARDQLVQEPTEFPATCADDNESLTDLQWNRWGAPTAIAKGMLLANDCKPSCADGTTKKYPVNVTMWDRKFGGKVGLYAQMKIEPTGAMPPNWDGPKAIKLPDLGM